MPNLPDAQEKTVDASWLTGLQDLIAALPADDAVAAVRQIAQALAAMNSIEQLPLTDRYNAVCRLDSQLQCTHSQTE